MFNFLIILNNKKNRIPTPQLSLILINVNVYFINILFYLLSFLKSLRSFGNLSFMSTDLYIRFHAYVENDIYSCQIFIVSVYLMRSPKGFITITFLWKHLSAQHT